MKMDRKCWLNRVIVCFLMMIIIIQIPMHAYPDEKRTVAIGTNAEYAPFEYLDSNGDLTGFDIDLMNAIAKEAGFEVKWVDLPFDSLLGSIEAGDIEAIAASIAPTEERAKSVDFSDVYYSGSQSLVYRTDEKYTDFSDIKGRTIAVLEGSQSDMIASGENTDYGVVEDATVKRFKNASSAIMELKNKGADAVIIDTIIAEIFCKQTDGIEAVPVKGTEEDTGFCIEKGNTEITELINDGLAKVKENGTYDTLYAKYFSGEESEQIIATQEEDGFIGTLKFIFVQDNRWKYYVNGLGTTLIVSLLSVLIGVILGLLVAIIRINAEHRGKRTIASSVAAFYVDVIRGTPSVLQLMIVYFAVFHSRLGYIAAVASFGINSGAYVSEVIRGGIQAVDKGQSEAGRSLGLSYNDTMRFVVIPQAVKNILPAMGNEFIQLIKETSILGYVGIVDLTKAASYVSSRTYQMFIPLLAAGIVYYLIVKVLSILLGKFERRLKESD